MTWYTMVVASYISHRLRTEWHKSPKDLGHLAVKMKLSLIAAAFFTTSLVINAKGRPSCLCVHNATTWDYYLVFALLQLNVTQINSNAQTATVYQHRTSVIVEMIVVITVTKWTVVRMHGLRFGTDQLNLCLQKQLMNAHAYIVGSVYNYQGGCILKSILQRSDSFVQNYV